MSIGERIREARKNKKLTQEELANIVGVAKSTITGYEKGNSEPNINVISKIVKALDIDANYLWQDDVNFPVNVSYLEMNKIKKYRILDKYGKDLVDSVLDIEYERCTTSVNEIHHRYITKPLYLHSVSAGLGEYLETSYSDMMEVEATDVTLKADYLLRVKGDSMTPEYNDGDIVAVKYASAINIGEIGVFIINNEGFIKKRGKDGLISLNPDYQLIKVGEYDSYKCVGEVLGIIE